MLVSVETFVLTQFDMLSRSTEVGQALLERHEAYVRRHEVCSARCCIYFHDVTRRVPEVSTPSDRPNILSDENLGGIELAANRGASRRSRCGPGERGAFEPEPLTAISLLPRQNPIRMQFWRRCFAIYCIVVMRNSNHLSIASVQGPCQ